ncbi:protein FAM234B-like [Mya arenaria]|uniref:protein FAM234B-like n=1 Tax=Mya arenaria TaxID=6604 RepID=UPI0022E16EE3|nr:protein FAM234B-like [Mya arenaria]
MADTTSYSQLPQADNSDEDWNDDVNQDVAARGALTAPEVVISDTDVLLHMKQRPHNGTALEFSPSRNRKYDNSFCSPKRAAICIVFGLLLFGLGYVFGYVTPSVKEYVFGDSGGGVAALKKRSGDWRTKMADWRTESCIRLVDVDQDGVLDVIIGLALGKDVTNIHTEADMAQFCKDNGLTFPCAGAVVALRGRDGKLLWKADSYAEVLELVCHGIDVNQDGVDDCIATGRLAEMRAINPLNGETLWEADTKYLNRGWNIYAPAAIPDVDEDGVADIIIAHGGDSYVPAQVHSRQSGHIIMVSGRTGQAIGSYMKTPEERETHMSPVVHTRRDGSQYILIGTGGEAIGGKLMAMSIPDFYRYVKGLPKDHSVPGTRGKYPQWGSKEPFENGTIDIINTGGKGVMVPPVLVDVNQDGVRDILVNAFNGVLALYDGETLDLMWKIEFEDRESYSVPAPGYFNDDDVLDFMVHWSRGAWPSYNTTDTLVIDGRDGSVLWNFTSNKYDVSSDLVAHTSAINRDVFIFKAQGREGTDPKNIGAINRATGSQRILKRRFTDTASWEFEETEINEENEALEGVLLPQSHFRNNRAVIDKNYIECKSDQSVFLAELFAMDITNMRSPLKLWEQGSEKYFYKLDESDREAVQANIAKYGSDHVIAENAFPWSHGRREVELDEDSKDALCILVQPDERTTGAIGDVDGDGKLDVIVNLVSVGVLRDEHARYVKKKFVVDIFKMSLDDALAKELYTPLNVTIHDKMSLMGNHNNMEPLRFMQIERQGWGGYMGSWGDSTYRD